ncbi:hypothetical protein OG218_01125 [Kineococcus sp. NBC_00420]|uniref:hypothetical protein n=1 Tax=Kineococcus sp. NBC_00420 TaxID=2903564 RepID=UPI002E1EA401
MKLVVLVQPNGRLAIWSTPAKALVLWDATDAQVVKYFATDAVDSARHAARWAIERSRAGHTPTRTPTWDAAVASTRQHTPDADL